MVYVNFPQNLTEEELILKQKYATLKKKVFFVYQWIQIRYFWEGEISTSYHSVNKENLKFSMTLKLQDR